MDELDRAVGSNPTSSVPPLNWLYALIRWLSADEFDSTNDSRMLKLLCFLSLQFFVETHVELHLPEFVDGMNEPTIDLCYTSEETLYPSKGNFPSTDISSSQDKRV
jgi:hypothetical protein